MSRLQRVQEQFNRVHHKLGSSPLILFLLGGLSLLLWTAVSVVQIQTSEYLALNNKGQVAGVAWQIVLQPWFMITGQAPIQVVTAWLYAWIVELTTLIFALALSVAVVKIRIANPYIGKWYIVFAGLLIVLNSWADYSSTPGNNPLVQFLVAFAIGGMAVVGLPLGIGLIEHGIDEMGEE